MVRTRHILRDLCELLVLRQVLDNQELVDGQGQPMVMAARPVLLLQVREVAEASEVVQLEKVEAEQMVLVRVHEKRVLRKIHRIALQLRSVSCTMNKSAVLQLQHVVEVALAQLMELAEVVQVPEVEAPVQQVEVSVAAEALASLVPVLLQHS